jgi:hypothetical protein
MSVQLSISRKITGRYTIQIMSQKSKKNQHPSKLSQRLKFVQKFVSMDYRHIIIVVKVVLVVVWCFLVVVVEEIE